jgi:hypothetical protein
MLNKLGLEATTRLATVGGKRTCVLRLSANDLPDWQRTCRIETVVSAGLDLGWCEFDPQGEGQLFIPDGLQGALVATIELAEPYGGARQVGTFRLTVDASDGITYEPLGLDGQAAGTADVFSRTASFKAPLATEKPAKAVPLRSLIERERCLPLPDRGDGAARVLTLHADPSTVLGRCYASQLRGNALEFLERLGETKIHWVTMWDDRWVNKISARIAYEIKNGEQSLEIRNITSYSQAANDLRLSSTAHGISVLPPSETTRFTIGSQDALTVSVVAVSLKNELVSCRFLEARLGKVRLPLFQTEHTQFRFPPEGKQGLMMHYLGIWLPLSLEDFERLLSVAGEPLRISFAEAGIHFWVRYRHGRGIINLTSNEDLKQGLSR